MTKLILSIIGSTLSLACLAQPTYTTNPQSFTAEDEVTISVNVTGTSLAGYTGDVWMWAWIAEGCASGCDAPTNINPAGNDQTKDAKMIRDANNPNLYSLTLVPSAFYKKAPSEIKKIGLKLKSASWNDGKQSDSDILISVEPLVFTPKINRVFPTKATKDDAITLYLDQKLSTDLSLKYQLSDFTISIKAYNENNVQVGLTKEYDAINSGDGLHYSRIIPSYTFGVASINAIKYQFKSKAGNVQSEEFSLLLFK
jgi:hypothetical protein